MYVLLDYRTTIHVPTGDSFTNSIFVSKKWNKLKVQKVDVCWLFYNTRHKTGLNNSKYAYTYKDYHVSSDYGTIDDKGTLILDISVGVATDPSLLDCQPIGDSFIKVKPGIRLLSLSTRPRLPFQLRSIITAHCLVTGTSVWTNLSRVVPPKWNARRRTCDFSIASVTCPLHDHTMHYTRVSGIMRL